MVRQACKWSVKPGKCGCIDDASTVGTIINLIHCMMSENFKRTSKVDPAFDITDIKLIKLIKRVSPLNFLTYTNLGWHI